MIKRLSALAIMLILVLGNVKTVNAQTILAKEVAESYQLVPAEIRIAIDRDGWKITTVESSRLNKEYGGDNLKEGFSVAGTTFYDEKTIYLSDKETLAKDAITHEIGHFVDYEYNTYFGYLPSQTEMFHYIFESESANELFGEYSSASEVEFFAQAFKLYCEMPEQLYTSSPTTYAYINEILSDLHSAYINGIEQEYIPQTYEIVRAW